MHDLSTADPQGRVPPGIVFSVSGFFQLETAEQEVIQTDTLFLVFDGIGFRD